MPVKTCPTCATEYDDDVRFCHKDGTDLPASTSAHDLVGRVVDKRYRVLTKLGEGGFGETFLVEDVNLNRKAAMKVLHAPDQDAAKRLHREMVVVSSINHAAFAQVYDVGMLPNERAYLLTEWIQGQSLQRILRDRGRLSLPDALAVAQQLADGLGALHTSGYVHRDIKPANVMIPGPAEHPVFGKAKLLDFGVLGVLSQRRATGLTQTGMFVGTPRYMAPEQVLALPQSSATDVYGLALLMAEMLYGRIPFEGAAESATSIMVRIAKTDPELPADAAIPEAVRALLARALSRDPTMRPPNGTAFASELEALRPSPPAWPAPPAAEPVPTPIDGPQGYGKTHLHIPPRRTSRPSGRVPQLSAPRSFSPALVTVLVILLVLAALTVLALRRGVTLPRVSGESLLWIAGGIVLAIGGVLLGNVVRTLARSRLHQVERDAERLLLGLQTKKSLSDTLQIEVTQIIERCRELDERLLGITIMKMIGEYDAATASDQRQAALMNVATLLEKLRGRLSPWYTRFEKQLAFTTSMIGVASGLISVAAGIMKIAKGAP